MKTKEIDPVSQLGVPHAGRTRRVVSHDHEGQGGTPGRRVEHLLGQKRLRKRRGFVSSGLKRRFNSGSSVPARTLSFLRTMSSRCRRNPLRDTSKTLKKNRWLNNPPFSYLLLQSQSLNEREPSPTLLILKFCPGGAPVWIITVPRIPHLQDVGLRGLRSGCRGSLRIQSLRVLPE